MNEVHHEAPPVGEELHIPGPSLLPFITAIGLTLVVIGTTLNLIFSVVGLVITVIVVIRWIGDTRRDVGELPEQHH